MHIAFLTMAGKAESHGDDELAAQCLRREGHRVDWVDWHRHDVPWHRYDGVVVRSPFDYVEDVTGFVRALEHMESATGVLNGLPWIRWNVDKRYLLDLAQRGVAVVPTRCIDAWTPQAVEAVRLELGAGDLIVKPTVGASGLGVQRLSPGTTEEALAAIVLEGSGPWLVQPLISSVLDEGELSLMFFGGDFSHAVQKVPRRGAFLVQEEHGGSTLGVTPPRAALQLAEQALDVGAAHVGAEGRPLYGRIDMVRGADGAYLVMEVEVIEPQLFLGHDEGAAARLADAIERRLGGTSGP